MARALGVITAARVWDNGIVGRGTIYAPDFLNDTCLIRGRGTRFQEEASAGGYLIVIVARKFLVYAEIAEIRGPEELYLRRGFRSTIPGCSRPSDSDATSWTAKLAQAMNGTSYALAPAIRRNDVYDAVGSCLAAGDSLCIFPEGISHDQPGLLPLKCRCRAFEFKAKS